MSPALTVVVVILAIILFFVLCVVVMYNRFVRQRTLVDESWSQTDVELTRRHELIPNLVATVKGYAEHEAEVLESLARAREDAVAHKNDDPKTRESSEEQLGRAVGRVLARAEAYPDLKASANFLELQDELTNTEDRIAAARRFYNGNVRAYNTRVSTFPSNVIAGIWHFEPKEFFELTDPAARTAPSVGFS